MTRPSYTAGAPPFFEDTVLEEITPRGSPVRSFRLLSTSDAKQEQVLLTFTPEGITIQGVDVPPQHGGNGMVSDRGVGLDWFSRDLDEKELCARFSVERFWQPEVASRDLMLFSAGAGASHAGALMMLAAQVVDLEVDGTAMRRQLSEMGIPDEVTYTVGEDYNVVVAGWLCALQRRFRDLRRQVQ